MSRYSLWKPITTAHAHYIEVRRECGPRVDPLLKREINKLNTAVQIGPNISARNLLYSMHPSRGCSIYTLLHNQYIRIFELKYMPEHWSGFKTLTLKSKRFTYITQMRNFMICEHINPRDFDISMLDNKHNPYYIHTSSLFYLRAVARIIAKRVRIFGESLTRLYKCDIPDRLRGLNNNDTQSIIYKVTYFIQQKNVRLLSCGQYVIFRNYPRSTHDDYPIDLPPRLHINYGASIKLIKNNQYHVNKIKKYITELSMKFCQKTIRKLSDHIKLFNNIIYSVRILVFGAQRKVIFVK